MRGHTNAIDYSGFVAGLRPYLAMCEQTRKEVGVSVERELEVAGISHVNLLTDMFDSYGSWCNHLERHQEKHNRRWNFERALTELDQSDVWMGYCGLCGTCARFELPSVAQGRERNLREEMICEHCRMNTRVRAGFLIAGQAAGRRDARIYLTEQASPNFVWLQRNYPNAIGSEYASDEPMIGSLKQYLQDLGGSGEIRFEDVTALSFEDGCLDAVVSFDVLEHVPDFQSAVKEFARVLRKDGVLVLTAPFVSQSEATLVRARLNPDGEIEHLMPAEYHGDPLGEGGILCFYHFGWDLLDHAREAGFSKAYMTLPWAPSLGLVDNLWTLVAFR